jgi:hypothetical protein
MGIYDQLSQLDKVSPPAKTETAEMTLNPEPEKTSVSLSAKSPAKTKKKSKNERLQESKNARMKESKQERKQESFLAEIQPYLDLRASNTVSFRYPDTLLAWLEEAVYQLKKERGKKVTKNAILVAALAYVLWDLEQNEQRSFLYQQFIQDE